jgi:hypothetical protein
MMIVNGHCLPLEMETDPLSDGARIKCESLSPGQGTVRPGPGPRKNFFQLLMVMNFSVCGYGALL